MILYSLYVIIFFFVSGKVKYWGSIIPICVGEVGKHSKLVMRPNLQTSRKSCKGKNNNWKPYKWGKEEKREQQQQQCFNLYLA